MGNPLDEEFLGRILLKSAVQRQSPAPTRERSWTSVTPS
jgi:hypothetical protein